VRSQRDSSLVEKSDGDHRDEGIGFLDESDDEEGNLKAYEEALIPTRNKKSCTRAIKFYWFWFVLVTVHIYIFIVLPSTVGECLAST
jgi:hypothetical protein